MRRGFVAFIVLLLVGLGLTGCGLFRFEQREPWRTQAEEACLAQHIVQPSAYMALGAKIDGPGSCGMDYPFKVSAFAGGSVGLKTKVTLACPIIPQIDAWLEEYVKPASMLYFGVPVVDLKAGSYSCRPRNNQSGAKTSEHAYGNAMDVMAFILADGREIPVEKGWKGEEAEQDFLREVFVGACQHFTTVLAPGSDPFHYNHIHLDLARHDPRGTRHICRPIIKFTPRIDPRQAPQPAIAATDRQPVDLAPVDMDEDLPADSSDASGAAGPYSADLPAPGGASSGAPSPVPPSAAVRSGPQTYAEPGYARPLAAQQPLVLSGEGMY